MGYFSTNKFVLFSVVDSHCLYFYYIIFGWCWPKQVATQKAQKNLFPGLLVRPSFFHQRPGSSRTQEDEEEGHKLLLMMHTRQHWCSISTAVVQLVTLNPRLIRTNFLIWISQFSSKSNQVALLCCSRLLITKLSFAEVGFLENYQFDLQQH